VCLDAEKVKDKARFFFFFFCQGRNELLSVGEGGKGRGVIIRAVSVRRDHEKLQDTSRTSRGMTVGVYVEFFFLYTWIVRWCLEFSGYFLI
jgi:hypothetical protein